jgi:UDP-N-acetyl-D-mannosaminuronate dehydrogenase
VLSKSPGAAIIKTLLSEWDTYVEYANPLVAAEQMEFVPKMNINANWTEEYLQSFDGIIAAVDQIGLDTNLLDHL